MEARGAALLAAARQAGAQPPPLALPGVRALSSDSEDEGAYGAGSPGFPPHGDGAGSPDSPLGGSPLVRPSAPRTRRCGRLCVASTGLGAP